MNILVTGGAGFIGSALIKKLLKSNENNVYNIDKLNYASNVDNLNAEIRKLNIKENDRYSFYNFDLIDEKKTNEAIKKSNPDIIFHLAAESHVDRSIKQPNLFIHSNIIGTFNLITAAKKYWSNLSNQKKKKFRFIHISTDEVFGSLGLTGQFNEESAYAPRSPYSSSKAASDHIAKSWFHTYSFPIIVTNCCNNYGPAQYPEKLIPLTIKKALKYEQIPLYGDGKNIREWIYIDDHIEALLAVAEKGIIGESYCIGSGIEITNREMLEKICSILNKVKPRESDYRNLITLVKDRPGHDFRYSVNSSKIKKQTGWKCNYNLDKGLMITLEWYLNKIDK